MPNWILALFFVGGFLLTFGISFAFLARHSAVQQRLTEIGRSSDLPLKHGPSVAKAGSEKFSSLRRIGQSLLFGVSKRVPLGATNPQLRQQMAIGGFLAPEAAQIFSGARLVLGTGMFVLFNALSLVGMGPEPSPRSFFLSILGAGLGFFLPNVWLSRRTRMRRNAVNRALPDFVDLLIICVEAGQGIDQAMARVARELETSHPIFSPELHIMNWELRAGKSRAECFRNLYARTGVADLKSFAAMMIQADRYGVSFGHSLRVFSETLRTIRRQAAEEAAAKTTVKVAFPLVLFIFPALMVIILAPAVLHLMMGSTGP